MSSKYAVAMGLGLAISGGVMAFAAGQEPKAPQVPPSAKAKETPGKKAPGAGFPDLVKGLKETPGCLGVETAQTSSGKNLIFAWFKDKAAAVAWYKSPMHRGAMGMMKGFTPTSHPLKNVKDPDRPVLVIASITFADRPMLEGIPIPISQISIESYQPVDGGISIGGSFAPEGMMAPEAKPEETPKK